MKKLMLAILVCNAVFFTSCNKDISSAEVTYTKATAIYGDLEELRNIPLTAVAKELINPGKIYVSEDLLLIGEEKEGIHIYDNSDPENPINISFIQIPENKEFFVHGTTIYAESLYDMLKIDLSDKNNPTLVERVENAFASSFSNDRDEVLLGFEFTEVTEVLGTNEPIWFLISQQEEIYFDYQNQIIPESAVPSSFAGSSSSTIGTVNRIAVQDEFVYVISNSNMTVFEDVGGFKKSHTAEVGWQMETIYPEGGALFIGTRNSMEIFDISQNAEFPSHIGSFWHATACDPVLPTGDIAYVTLRTGDDPICPGDQNALIVVNTEDYSIPYQLQEIAMKSPYGMTLIDDVLYVGEGENGLKSFDATNRSKLVEINHDSTVKAYDIIAHPYRSDLILIAGPTGFGQYQIDAEDDNLSLISWISH